MGFSENFQDHMGFQFDPRKWVITGIQSRPPLVPIYTNLIHKELDHCDTEDQPPTPTGDDCRIRSGSKCPPAPKKRKSSMKFNHGNVRQFFKPPDLEVVFSRHVERAN
ncbi:cyclin-dependent protein kinase inhibitor SMR6-like [Cucurbita moschata]|uniref:Cyclin-dependent protein kinase inhibitor SMR6-like n=1 Tax=Cucurbita moschata TaxID=3662 RepID=A0A6J1H1H9_CUCMO|nr:cyclin-dependent protein kinase inhibitor SMR6-like [Cucurbita moschata]